MSTRLKTLITRSFSFLALVGVLTLHSASAVAAVNLASSGTGSDATLIRQADGTMYLSTETTDGTRANDGYTGRRLRLSPTGVVVPTGFATDFGNMLNAILSFVMVLASLLVFLYLVWGAFDWITSGGDKAKTEKARNKIVSAIIGLIIVAASYAVLNLVVRFLGFADFNAVLENVRTIDGRGGNPSATSSALPITSPLPSMSPSPTPNL